MEAHNCEYADVYVPCEIVMRLGDLGAEYVQEQQASFSTPGLAILPRHRGLWISYRIPFPRLYFRTCTRQRNRSRPKPRGLWKCPIFHLENIDKTERFTTFVPVGKEIFVIIEGG